MAKQPAAVQRVAVSSSARIKSMCDPRTVILGLGAICMSA